jgi:hypothetical protein
VGWVVPFESANADSEHELVGGIIATKIPSKIHNQSGNPMKIPTTAADRTAGASATEGREALVAPLVQAPRDARCAMRDDSVMSDGFTKGHTNLRQLPRAAGAAAWTAAPRPCPNDKLA